MTDAAKTPVTGNLALDPSDYLSRILITNNANFLDKELELLCRVYIAHVNPKNIG